MPPRGEDRTSRSQPNEWLASTGIAVRPAPRCAKRIRRSRGSSSDEIERQNDGLELIASENFVSPAVLEAMGSSADEQVRRGAAGQALLRRLRDRGPGRADRDRSRQAAVRRRPRQRAAALGRVGERRGVPRLPEAGRHAAGAGPLAGRPPHARLAGELLRPAVPRGALRRERRRLHRLRPAARRGAKGAARS